ncbi:MAG: methyl-accepting chemotaxis protein [Treponema sp.]|jgi:methyl-accepting chemotaxis protein|nr:methyl-accepting chemotaxis protein [Treponema sp.]
MHSLKTRFFLLFTVLGVLISLGVGLVMYTQYDRYIKDTYLNTLTRTAVMIEGIYPELADPEALMREGVAHSAVYWDLMHEFKHIADTLDMAYIYLLVKDGGGFSFRLDTDYAEAPDTPLDSMFEPYNDYPEAIDDAYTSKTLALSEPYTDEFGTFVSAFMPIVKDGVVVSVLGLDYEITFIRTLTGKALIALLVALLLAAFVSGVFAFVISLSLIKPIRGAMSALKSIANGDVSQKVVATSKDEFGEMMRFLDQTQDGIKALIVAINDKATILASVGAELSSMMNQSAASIDHISVITEGMKQKATTQAASVTETNATMGQIVTNIVNLNTNIGEQASSVVRSSSAVEQMTENIASVTKSLEENQRNVEQLQAASNQGHTALQKVALDLQEVTDESQHLLEINKVIENIASQTNLLSMNAAIEAAHAGLVGKGFSVVSGEIRKLAESSSEQAKSVAAVLKKIKGALDGISASTGAALTHFEAIDHGVKTVSAQEASIRDAMEAQDAGSREVLSMMAVSSAITEKVRDGSASMLTGTREVIGEGKNLEALTADLTNAMNETAVGMGQINDAIARILTISQDNKESIDALVRELTKFKVI